MDLSSREYKLMLREKRFKGDDTDRRVAIDKFWTDIGTRLSEAGIVTTGNLDELKKKKQRDVFFLDTKNCDLYRNSDLVFRLRRPLISTDDWEATLKFRHGDRQLAEAQDFRLRVPKDPNDDDKFEEDIKAVPPARAPRFWALFSRSVEANFGARELPKTVAACLAPFDGIDGTSLPAADRKVSAVGDLKIVEHVYENGSIILSDTIKAECGLILWWRKQQPDEPIAAEFSFRFELAKGQTETAVARNAWTVMTILCGSRWVNPEGSTKTALVYGKAEV